MPGNDLLFGLFVVEAFLFQVILIVHFAMRKWRFDQAIKFGPTVYALGIPSAILSLVFLAGGIPLSFWLGGFIYLCWGIYAYWVEYMKKIEWRSPIHWKIFIPYITLYLATVMFFWWPLALNDKTLWNLYAVLFIITTYLNISSHKK
jgi:hypothetical protein